MTGYIHEVDVAVRFRDLDPMEHVNNAVYATYLEHARDAYFRDVVGVALADVDSVLAHLELDFERPVTRSDETVTVATRVPELGETSIPMEYAVRVGDATAATGSTVQVAYDSDAGTPAPLPGEWRDRIRSFEGLPADP
jgi:acyl-CoA thioester hydrolase